MPRTAAALLALLVAVSHVAAAQTDSARSAEVGLRGLAALTVIVDDLPPAAANALLFDVQVRTDVELRLRRAGVRVLPEAQAPAGAPYLYVAVHLTETTSGVQAWSTAVEFEQRVVLLRLPTLSTFAATWRATERLGLSPPERAGERVRAALADQVDEFVNAWLAANPVR